MSFRSITVTFFIIQLSFSTVLCNDFKQSLNFSIPLLPPLQNEFPTKCLQDLGCFQTGPPFYHPILRPVVLLPFDEHNIPTKFLLYTRRNPIYPQLLDHNYNTIRKSSFNPYCPTKIIIHGFTVNPMKSEEYTLMKNAMLKKGRYNVIIVDWSDSNQAPYFQAIANGRVVGAQTARLIHALQIFTGANPERFHIIGHSLGAAVAGWTGERFQNLGRITGLDPAGMYFYNAPAEMRLDTSDADFVDVIITNGAMKYEDGLDPAGMYFYNAPPEMRLDPSDADFVDIIMTNVAMKYEDGIATLEPIGHVNFYPNGGSIQPGCFNSTKELKDFDFNRNLCSHFRSLFLFIMSISNEHCHFTGITCEDYRSYSSGKCGERFWWRSLFDHSPHSKTAEMGFNARKPYDFNYTPSLIGLKYYLKTSAEPPFCTQNNRYRSRSRSFVRY